MFNREMNIQKQDKSFSFGKSAFPLSVVGDAFVPRFVDLIVGHCFVIIMVIDS